MSIIIERLSDFLDRHAVPYQLIHHQRDYSAQSTAHDTHTPGHRFIKSVILKAGHVETSGNAGGCAGCGAAERCGNSGGCGTSRGAGGGGRFIMAVIPADRHINLNTLADWLDVEDVSLASEQETFAIFTDCEVGAEPPLGNLYGIPVFVDPEISDSESVTFNGGTHETAVRMRWADYFRLVQPVVPGIATT